MTRRPSSVRLLVSPFHYGLEAVDRGRGPERLLELVEESGVLTAFEPRISVETVGGAEPALPEASRVFGHVRALAERVRVACAADAFPLVLAGDCNSCLGTVAGSGSGGLGVIWLDAHADFDTPDTSISGSIDAMGLAVLAGQGWTTLRETIEGLSPIDEERIVLVGTRDLEPGQRDRLQRSRIAVLEGNGFTDSDLRTTLDDIRTQARRAYLHIDLDALDPGEGIANQYSAPGGLSRAQVEAVIASAFERFDVVAGAITAYNPDSDEDGRMGDTATQLLVAVVERALRGLS